jgi:hypothetical protein
VAVLFVDGLEAGGIGESFHVSWEVGSGVIVVSGGN